MSSTKEGSRHWHTVLGLFALFALAFLGQAALATPDSVPDRTDEIPEYPNDPAKAPSVLSLKDDYGLSTDQAIDQMQRQVAAGTASTELPPKLGEVYSGREMHHEDGARVVVGMTDPGRAEAMRRHFASYGVDNIDIQIFEHTKRHLDATAKQLQRRSIKSRGHNDEMSVQVGRASLGKVTLKYVEGSMNPTEKDILSKARRYPDMFAVSEVDRIEGGQLEACERNKKIWCDPPLRGSVWMHPPDDSAPCSAGFNVKSRSDGKPYVLTAGHCDGGQVDSWRTRFADGDAHEIGPFHNSEWSQETDAGIMTVNNPSGWDFGEPWITVNPNEGGWSADDTYEISKVAEWGDLADGDRVCVTGGNFPATTCGDVYDNCVEGKWTDCLIELKPDTKHGDSDLICTKTGDSGGPYFAWGVAYGIHINSPSNDCADWVRGEHTFEAEDEMNVDILTS